MRDYYELIERLRYCADRPICFSTQCDYRQTAHIGACFDSLKHDAADAIEELLADRNKALKKLCEWCGVCSEENRKALECDDIAMLDAPHWISVEERLPEPFVCVLAHIPGEKPFPTVKSAFLEKTVCGIQTVFVTIRKRSRTGARCPRRRREEIMIIETCPKCGHDLQHLTFATYPPIPAWYCPNCKWRYEKRENIVRVPFREPPAEPPKEEDDEH